MSPVVAKRAIWIQYKEQLPEDARMYLIDGHNLIGQLPDISLHDPNDEAKLVQKLAGFAARTRTRIVVIFDNGITGGRSRMSTRSVEVVFASSRSNADRLMLERIRAARDTGAWVVVSNDNVVLEAARRRRMRAVKSSEFVGMMRPAQPATKDDDAKAAADPYVSPAEVEAWLRIFSAKR